jgi:hypothetical protein
MRKFLLLFAILPLPVSLFCQLSFSDPQGLDYFEKGSNLINIGNYKGADSLLTLALCSYKNENVYFNRAVSRLLQTDTAGYCEDMNIAANKYFDKEAQRNYNILCCLKVDTFYYDNKRSKSNKSDYRYYEVIKHPKTDSVIYGTYHDIKSSEPVMYFDFGCNNNLVGANSVKTDIIAGYIIEDYMKYFFKSTKNIFIFNTTAYISFKKRAGNFLSAKYATLKSDNGGKNIRVYFKVYFDSMGNVFKVNFADFYPEISIQKNDHKELEKDLLDIAEKYPKVNPAKFFKDNVCFVGYDSIEF